jgi:site-specific DNA-methyltransferase (adenine-specific)
MRERLPGGEGNDMVQPLYKQETLEIVEQAPKTKGTCLPLSTRQLQSNKPKPFYTHPHGEIWVGDAILWLKSLESESVDLIFADPPYNIKKAEWDTFESQQAYLK